MHRPVNRSFILLLRALLLLLQLCSNTAYAAKQMTDEQWRQLHAGKEFDYSNETEKVRETVKYTPSTWEKMLRAFFNFWNSDTGTVVMWLLVAGLASWLIYKIFIQKDSFLFGRESKSLSGNANMDEEEKDLASTNWETLLQHAVENKDLRLATRYCYMWTLQLMQQRELIKYRIDKTNYEYYTELAQASFRQSFRQLSRQYEYVWYGRFELSQATYAEYRKLFDNVKRQMGA